MKLGLGCKPTAQCIWHKQRKDAQQSKFTFTYIAKTGGNSLQNVLRDFSEDEIIPMHRGDKELELERFNLEEDFRKVCDILDIPFSPLPHRNKSRRRPYQHYHDEELDALIRSQFRDEIEFGGYEL